MLDDLQRSLDRLNNQARFVQMIIDNKLVISKKKKIILMAELKKLSFRPFPKIEDAKQAGEDQQAAEDSENEEDGAMGIHDYDYLLGVSSYLLFLLTLADCPRCRCGHSRKKESRSYDARLATSSSRLTL